MKRLWLILISLWLSSIVLAQSDNTVLPDNTRVRSGPGESFFSIGALFAGETVTPLNRNQDGTWVLIIYGRDTGWISRQDVNWQADIESLEALSPNITPTPLASLTPVPMANEESPLVGLIALNDADSALVRSGPGRGYGRVGQLTPGILVEPVSRSEDGLWILIRFKDVTTLFDGFGWVARHLVQWRDNAGLDTLPVMLETALTPTLTLTPSETLSGQAVTAIPVISTITPLPTETETPSFTSTPVPPTATFTPESTATFTPEPTVTLITEIAIVETVTPFIAINSPVPTFTDMPTDTPVETQESSVIVDDVTETPLPPVEISPTDIPQNPSSDTENAEAGFPMGAIIAGGVVLVALAYAGLFASAATASRRYESGFVIETCPVCERGALTVEVRQYRTLGIPGVRRTVRCDECRSVLREKGQGRWIYAVDRIENPSLYEHLNGREVTDDDLKKLSGEA